MSTKPGAIQKLDAVIVNVGGADARIKLAATGAAMAMARTQDVVLPAGSQKHVRFDLPFRPVELVIDPEAQVLLLNRGNARRAVSDTLELLE